MSRKCILGLIALLVYTQSGFAKSEDCKPSYDRLFFECRDKKQCNQFSSEAIRRYIAKGYVDQNISSIEMVSFRKSLVTLKQIPVYGEDCAYTERVLVFDLKKNKVVKTFSYRNPPFQPDAHTKDYCKEAFSQTVNQQRKKVVDELNQFYIENQMVPVIPHMHKLSQQSGGLLAKNLNIMGKNQSIRLDTRDSLYCDTLQNTRLKIFDLVLVEKENQQKHIFVDNESVNKQAFGYGLKEAWKFNDNLVVMVNVLSSGFEGSIFVDHQLLSANIAPTP